MDSPLLLVAFNQEPAAKLLIDYLKSQDIGAYYVVSDELNGHGVALRQSSDFSQAKLIAEEFMRDPTNQRYQKAAWEHGNQLHFKTTTGASAFKRLINFAATPFTSIVFLICVAVFALSLFGWFGQVLSNLQMQSFTELSDNAQWWRVVTPVFIHFSPLHIVFNLLWWWMLGGQIERHFGSSTLAILFFFSAILSNLGQYLASGANFGGLSGVVYAVVGFVWWIGWLRPAWGLALPKPVIGFLLVWLVLGYADLLWVNMANTAHTLGLVAGCAFALIMSRLKSREDAV